MIMMNNIPNWAKTNESVLQNAAKTAANAKAAANAKRNAQVAANRAESALRKVEAVALAVLAETEGGKSPPKKFVAFTGSPRTLGSGPKRNIGSMFLEASRRQKETQKEYNIRMIKKASNNRRAELAASEALEKQRMAVAELKKTSNRMAAQARRNAQVAANKAAANKATANKAAANKAAANKAARANAAAKKAALLQKEAEAWAARIYAREKMAYNKAVREGARRRASAANKAARISAALQAQLRMNKGANERLRTRLANEAKEWRETAASLANWNLGGVRRVAALREQRTIHPLFGPENMKPRPKQN
jgi:hypothetical protein